MSFTGMSDHLLQFALFDTPGTESQRASESAVVRCYFTAADGSDEVAGLGQVEGHIVVIQVIPVKALQPRQGTDQA